MGRDRTPSRNGVAGAGAAAAAAQTYNGLLPPGNTNLGNTCFLNSVLQSLSSTPGLRPLLDTPFREPGAVPLFNRASSPALDLHARGEHEPLLALTDTFLRYEDRYWSEKGGVIKPRELLKSLAKKFDQYNDFGQQDAHELLRHLLDAMHMEELDVIKKLHPPSPGGRKRRRSEFGTPEHGLTPFVDSLFCGKLVNVVVCEGCRKVSHVYEDFFDISLGLQADSPAARKRDRLKSIAAKFKRSRSARPGERADGLALPDSEKPLTVESVVLSDTELSDTESAPGGARPRSSRRSSMDTTTSGGGGGAGIARRMSSRLGRFSRGSTASGEEDRRAFAAVTASAPGSRSASPAPSRETGASTPRKPKVPPAELAYIKLLLGAATATSNGASTPSSARSAASDPLALLRRPPPSPNGEGGTPLAAHAQEPTSSGLEDCLAHYTNVEVLDGENSFACHRCWKIENPVEANLNKREKAARRRKEAGGVGEEGEPKSALSSIPSHGSRSVAPTLSPIHDVEDPGFGPLPPSPQEGETPEPAALSPPGDADEAPPAGASPDVSQPQSHPPDLSPLSLDTSPPDPPPAELDRPPIPTMHIISPSASSPPPLASPSDDHPAQVDLAPPRAPSPAGSTLSVPRPRSCASASRSDDEAGYSTSTSLGETTDDSGESSNNESSSAAPPRGPGIPRTKRADQVVLRRALKRVLIASTPEVLVLHFKRFQQLKQTSVFFSTFKKVDDYISFPMHLDIAPFVAPPRAEAEEGKRPAPVSVQNVTAYRLFSVVVHIGTMLGGHYVVYFRSAARPRKRAPADVAEEKPQDDAPVSGEGEAKEAVVEEAPAPPPVDSASAPPAEPEADAEVEAVPEPDPAGDQWFYASDESVRPATEQEVLRSKGYLLFYSKVRA